MDSFGNESGSEKQKSLASGPKTRVCYICGRQYGLSSYEIHLKQCKELWIAREAKKDPKERKKLPEDPLLSFTDNNTTSSKSNSSSSGHESESKKNSKIDNNEMKNSSTKNLSLEEINRISSAAFNTESLSICEYCNRSFLPEKLLIHNKSCTSDNPARKITDSVKRGKKVETTTGTDEYPEPPKSAPANTRRPKNDKKRVSFDKNASNDNSNNNTSDEDDKTIKLKIENGSLVGHLGGSSGRFIRRPSSRDNESKTSNNNNNNNNSNSNNNDNNNNKQLIIKSLSDKINKMETTVLTLIHSIRDMKETIDQLQNNP